MENTPAKTNQGSNVIVVDSGSNKAGTTKLILGGAAIVSGLFLGNKLIKNLRDNSSSDGYTKDERTETITDPKTGKKITRKWSPSQIAAEYSSAMGGKWDGTAVQTIIELADKSKGKRWESISESFRRQTGTNLVSKLKDELKILEYSAFNSVIGNTAKHKFGSKEILHIKSVSGTLPVMNSRTKKLEFPKFRWDGSLLRVVTGRYTGKTGNRWYRLSKFPDYLFREEDLVRRYDDKSTWIWLTTGIGQV